MIKIATQKVGPRLRTVYEEGLAAQAQREKGPLIVEPKNPRTFELTTSADRTVDGEIRAFWQEAFPNIPLLSEDSGDRRLRGMSLEQLQRLPVVLVVDPVDGSGRLARHSERFSSSFALVIWGRPVLAVVYQPVTDTLWTAEQGEGALRNDQRIYVSDTRRLNEAMVSTAFAWDLKKRRQNQKSLDRLVYFVNQVIGTASSVLDIAEVAQGSTDAHISIGLKPWDMAGSSLLVEKAGGKVTSFTGEDWTPFQSDILASNGLIHSDLLNIINRNAILAALMRLYQIYIRRDIRNRRPIYNAFNRVKEGIIFLGKKSSK